MLNSKTMVLKFYLVTEQIINESTIEGNKNRKFIIEVAEVLEQ